jgi:hypothetical protein
MTLFAVLAIAAVMLAIGDIVAGAVLLRPVRAPVRSRTSSASERWERR